MQYDDHTYGAFPASFTYNASTDGTNHYLFWLKQEQPSIASAATPWMKVVCEPADGDGSVGGWISGWCYPRSDGEGSKGSIMAKVDWAMRPVNELGKKTDVSFWHNSTTGADSEWVSNVEEIDLKKWQRVDVVFNKASVENDPEIYIDGVLIPATEITSATTTFDDDSAHNLVIGDTSGTRVFDGFISTCKIHSNPPTNVSGLISLEYQAETNPDFIVVGQMEHYLEQADIIVQDIIDSANKDMPVLDETVIPNLVGYYKLDNDALDRSDTGANGTWAGVEQYRDGIYADDKCAFFNGTSNINCGNNFDFDFFDELTVSFWYKGTNDAAFSLFGKTDVQQQGGTTGGWGITQRSADEMPRFTMENSSNQGIDVHPGVGTFKTALNSGTWHHVVFTKDTTDTAAGVKIYMDGILNETNLIANDDASGSASNSLDFKIGSESDDGNYTPNGGHIDEVRIYDRELSFDEVQKLYKATQSDKDTVRQMVKWKLGDGHSTYIPNELSLHKLDQTTLDAKGNHDGFVIGNESYVDGKFGKAFDFDGTTRVILGGDESDYDFDRTDGFTVMCWVKNIQPASNRIYVCKGNQLTVQKGWYFFQNSGTLFFNLVETQTTNEMRYKGTARVDDGEWHHVVVTKAVGTGLASEITMYVDGVKDGAPQVDSLTTGDILNDEPVSFGQEADGSSAHITSMDDVRIFNRELTETEVKRIYEASGSFIDDPRDDDIPTESIGVNFEHKDHLDSLKKIAKATGKDLFFDSEAHRVYIKTKGKQIKEKFTNMKITKPKFKLDNVANIVNIVGNDKSEGVQREKTFEDTNTLKYDYEKTIANKQIATDDTLDSLGAEVLTSLKDLTPDLTIDTTPDQFNRFDLQVGDVLSISELSQDLQGKFKIIKLDATQKGIKLSLSSETNQTIQTSGKDLGSIMSNLINAMQDINITPE
jgi:hypothetical protein